MSCEPGADDVGSAFEEAIARELADLHRSDLRGPASLLSSRYRSESSTSGPPRFAPAEVRAYLATRAPATFAATRRVLKEVASLRPDFEPRSVLDLGAGPGTATWAAAAVFASIGSASLVERDQEMAALGARLAASGSVGLLADASWTIADANAVTGPECDLVLAAYVLGELSPERRQSALGRWWGATLGELVLVEPGTPAGFERLREARSQLIAWGGHVTAPCPHDERCPMQGSDWCHFAVRLPRSPLHRDVKGGRLGYEDEKYSYLAASRSRLASPVARLVRSPRPHKGHVRVWLCGASGLAERVVSRRDGEAYKRARAARWGERLDVG